MLHVVAGDAPGQLDLDGNDVAVGALDDEVNLLASSQWGVPERQVERVVDVKLKGSDTAAWEVRLWLRSVEANANAEPDLVLDAVAEAL